MIYLYIYEERKYIGNIDKHKIEIITKYIHTLTIGHIFLYYNQKNRLLNRTYSHSKQLNSPDQTSFDHVRAVAVDVGTAG